MPYAETASHEENVWWPCILMRVENNALIEPPHFKRIWKQYGRRAHACRTPKHSSFMDRMVAGVNMESLRFTRVVIDMPACQGLSL